MVNGLLIAHSVREGNLQWFENDISSASRTYGLRDKITKNQPFEQFTDPDMCRLRSSMQNMMTDLKVYQSTSPGRKVHMSHLPMPLSIIDLSSHSGTDAIQFL